MAARKTNPGQTPSLDVAATGEPTPAHVRDWLKAIAGSGTSKPTANKEHFFPTIKHLFRLRQTGQVE